MKGVLSYAPGNSIFHRMNPITKIILALCICVAAFVTDYHLYLIAILAMNMAIGAMGGIFQRALRLLKGLSKICLFLFVLQLLFVRSGNRIFLFITDTGVSMALRVVLRLMCACIPLALMLNLTQISDLSNALVSVVHLPYKYAFTITTAIRFIPVFMEEMSGIMEAQTARGVEFDTGNFLKKIKLIVPMCAPLLISSVRKIDGTAVAAEVRGFELRTRKSGYKKYPFRGVDMLAFVFCAAIIALAVVLPYIIR